MDDPFVILGLEPPVTDASLKTAFRRMAMATHPDRKHQEGERAKRQATDDFNRVVWAYEQLSDLDCRDYYTRVHGSPQQNEPQYRTATRDTQARAAQRAEEYAGMSLDEFLHAALNFAGDAIGAALILVAKSYLPDYSKMTPEELVEDDRQMERECQEQLEKSKRAIKWIETSERVIDAFSKVLFWVAIVVAVGAAILFL